MSKTTKQTDKVTFKSLGLEDIVVKITQDLGYKEPTPIQRNAIPEALKKKDVIGIAQTGSGKTAAFLLPVINSLLNTKMKDRNYYCLIIEPTRELAMQVVEVIEKMSRTLEGLTSCALIGGIDLMKQSIALAKKPNIIVGTPGRIVYHIKNTAGMDANINKVKFLIIDEADKLLEMDFSKELDYLFEVLPSQRTSLLFSATMSKQVESLQKASLKSPVRVQEEEQKYETVATLKQQYMFIPFKKRDAYLYTLLQSLAGKAILIFTMKCSGNTKLVMMLRQLGINAIPLHGKMTQQKRLLALNKFKSGKRAVLVATDVASRGLDIPDVDVVINYDCPLETKEYIHRVGRTARAGKSGLAITIVTQYSIELYQRIESAIGMKLSEYQVDESKVDENVDKVTEAMIGVSKSLKEEAQKRKDKEKKESNTGNNDMEEDD